tara:strand:+ start:60 stop:998 length:939 start_codon:yes stop_codon:yes gene_type:complete
MKILVTGSKGVVGQLLVEKLKQNGHRVIGCDLLHHPGQTGFSQVMSNESLEYIRCDIGLYRQIERIIINNGPFDIVYNCAAEFGRWNGEDFFEQLWNSNVVGLKNLLSIQTISPFKLVHFSSSEVYGDFGELMKESVMDDFEIKQLNDYAISKWTNEMQIRNHEQMYDSENVVVRLFNTYGPGETYHPYRSVNAKFCYHALNNLPINLYKGHFRSSTYIHDCVDALTNISKNFIPGRTYNIASTNYHDIETIADIIWSYTGASRDLINYKETEILTTINKKADNTLSVNELDFKDSLSLDEGIKKTIDWMRQ